MSLPLFIAWHQAGGDVPRLRGRPRNVFVKKGRSLLKAARESLWPSATASPDPEAPGPESASARVPLTGDLAQEARLADEDYGRPTERTEAESKPIWLQYIDREAKGWVHIDTVNTEDLPGWFVKQKNDYQRIGRRTESRCVHLNWFGHPGDSPHDIRARKFVARWAPQAPNGSELRTSAIRDKRPVWRWLYACAGVHDRAPPEEHHDSDSSSDDQEGEDTGSEEDGESAPEVRLRSKKCSSAVQLQFEVTADDLGVVKIWQSGKHNDASPSQYGFLTFCRFLRLQVMDRYRRYGAKSSAVQRDLVQTFLHKNSSGDEEPLPPYRIPTQKQTRSMLTAGRQRERLDKNPFRATWLMVKRNPRDMYCYTPHDFSQDDSKSKFKVAITDDFSLDSTILNTEGPNGGAYLVSANIKSETVSEFFTETVGQIVFRAKEVVADPSKIKNREPAARDRILKRCQHIAEQGFDLSHISMDKSRSQYNGIYEALRELGIEHKVYLRLCQFHVVQAILRADTDSGQQGLGFAMPFTIKFEIVVLFRQLQRCRSYKDWDEAKQVFHAGLAELLGDEDQASLAKAVAEEQEMDGSGTATRVMKKGRKVPKPRTKAAKASGKSCLEIVQSYFDKNWFVDPWIPMFTDIGMPSDQSRDGTWNTNNWAETAFKQFNTIFLDNKHNKRIDRLCSIILNDHLPYFRYFPTPDRPVPKAFLAMNLEAHRLWDRNMVSEVVGTPNKFTVIRKIPLYLIRFHATATSISKQGKFVWTLQRPDCYDRMVPYHHGTSLVPVTEYRTEKDLGMHGEKRSNKTNRSQHSKAQTHKGVTGKLPNDASLEAELYRVLDKLRDLEAAKQEHALEPTFGEFQVKTSKGRPAHAKPLHPWRRKRTIRIYPAPGVYGYSPRFTKKRGPPKRQRLHFKSLFPATSWLVHARRKAYMERIARHRLMDAFTVNRSGLDTKAPIILSTQQTPHDNDSFLNSEDIMLNTMNADRWNEAEYEMRQDEMGLFIPFFNNSVMAVEKGVIFLYGAPHVPFAERIWAMDWSQPLSVNQLRGAGLDHLAELTSTRKDQQVNHIIFFELRARHWTTYHHNLITSPPQILLYNSLPLPETEGRYDVGDQVILQQCFLRPKMGSLQPIRIPDAQFTPFHLGLQQESFTCGFWAVYIAFSVLLSFPPVNLVALSMSAHQIKELIGPIYLSFIGNELGVPASLISYRPSDISRAVLDKIRAPGSSPETDDIVQSSPLIKVEKPAPHHSVDPQTKVVIYIALSKIQVLTVVQSSSVAVQANSEHYLLRERPQPAELEPGFQCLLQHGNDFQWDVVTDAAVISAGRLAKLVNGDLVSDAALDGYLSLLALEMAKATHDQTIDSLPFHITGDIFRNELFKKGKRNSSGIGPPARSNPRFGVRKRWFEKVNIFTKDRLIVPVFWEAINHWLLAVAFFGSRTIRIYDSVDGQRRAKAVFGWIYEMLLYEYKQLNNGVSMVGWEAWSPKAIVHVSEQTNKFDCAIHTAVNAECVAQCIDPAGTVYTADMAAQGRILIANRLYAAIQSCPRNFKALGTNVPASPPPEASSKASVSKSRRRFTTHPNRMHAGMMLPAKTIGESEEGIELEWDCGLLFMADNERPSGRFNSTIDEWNAAELSPLRTSQLLPVMWPAGLAHSSARRFLTYVEPSDRALAAELESESQQVIRYICNQEPPTALFTQVRHDFLLYRSHHPELESHLYDLAIFPSFRFMRISSHEAMVQHFSDSIQAAVNSLEAQSEHETADLTSLAEGVGPVSLWVAYMRFVTQMDDSNTVYTAMKEGHGIEWPETEADILWAAYQRVIDLSPGEDLYATLQIVVPHLPVAPPVLKL
ncbi:hypothetical protein C8R43DRAFT_941883 [Mycena crocata]|nr:hypothetical protein C8R43DRAFT_941883 [Mycena crocata]